MRKCFAALKGVLSPPSRALAALPNIVISSCSIHQRRGWLPRYTQLQPQLGLMTQRGRQSCSSGSSDVLFINRFLKRHLTLLHQSSKAPARASWCCLPASDWLRCSSPTTWPTSGAGGPGQVWTPRSIWTLFLSAASLWKSRVTLTLRAERLTRSSSDLYQTVSPPVFLKQSKKFKADHLRGLLELRSANCSPVKTFPCVGMCHPSLSVAAHSCVLAHDSFSASVHRLIDISIGTPTRGKWKWMTPCAEHISGSPCYISRYQWRFCWKHSSSSFTYKGPTGSS